MNQAELIHEMAHLLDPQVFDHQGALPPDNFFGSPEWWEISKNSRRQRATKDAAAALRAIDTLGLAVVPRAATEAMAHAGASRLGANDAAVGHLEQMARQVWETMLNAANADGAM